MKPSQPQENTGRVIALALAFFGGLALLGWAQGVFGRLSPATLAALGAFALGFAALTWRVDGALRESIRRAARAALRKSPATSPGASPAAPSAPRTSARGSAAARVRAAR